MAEIENNDPKKATTWGSTDITFGSVETSKKQSEEQPKIEDQKSEGVKHSPEIKSEHDLLFDNHWLKVKRSGGFVYSERKGIDSVAFILIAMNAADERRIGLIHEYKNPIGRFLNSAFGGSIDDEKFHDDLRTLVKEEVVEESGFEVGIESIEYHGKVMVSAQSNQFCHLFSVEVDKLKQGDKTTTNPAEQRDSLTWITMREVPDLEDWKAQAIILRRMMKRNGLVFVSTPKK